MEDLLYRVVKSKTGDAWVEMCGEKATCRRRLASRCEDALAPRKGNVAMRDNDKKQEEQEEKEPTNEIVHEW